MPVNRNSRTTAAAPKKKATAAKKKKATATGVKKKVAAKAKKPTPAAARAARSVVEGLNRGQQLLVEMSRDPNAVARAKASLAQIDIEAFGGRPGEPAYDSKDFGDAFKMKWQALRALSTTSITKLARALPYSENPTTAAEIVGEVARTTNYYLENLLPALVTGDSAGTRAPALDPREFEAELARRLKPLRLTLDTVAAELPSEAAAIFRNRGHDPLYKFVTTEFQPLVRVTHGNGVSFELQQVTAANANYVSTRKTEYPDFVVVKAGGAAAEQVGLEPGRAFFADGLRGLGLTPPLPVSPSAPPAAPVVAYPTPYPGYQPSAPASSSGGRVNFANLGTQGLQDSLAAASVRPQSKVDGVLASIGDRSARSKANIDAICNAIEAQHGVEIHWSSKPTYVTRSSPSETMYRRPENDPQSHSGYSVYIVKNGSVASKNAFSFNSDTTVRDLAEVVERWARAA